MKWRALLSFVMVFASTVASSAPAPQPSEAAKGMVGKWEFSNAARDKVCNVIFRTDPGPAGMKLEFEQPCYALFPFLKEVVGWRFAENDFLRLVNARGRSVLEFSEVESRMFEALRQGEGRLLIEAAGSAVPDITPEQMNGDWTMVRGAGRAICTLTLSGTAAGEGFAVKVNPPCEPFVTRFNPVSWRLERGGLSLFSARGDSWLFEAEGPTKWQRIPRTADPIMLVRK
jgi:hypothetical protein